MVRPRPGAFYPVTDSGSPAGLGHLELVQLLLAAGVRFLQIREKRLPDGDFFRVLLEIADLCNRAGAAFVVNDRVDLALACGAAGVHLGQTDLPVGHARRLLGPRAVIGVSTHSEEQLRLALKWPVDYIAVGPIFATSTKKSEYRPLGLDFVRTARGLTDLPLVAIGGIGLENAEAVWAAGADSVAVISDVAGAPDPGLRARQFLLAARRREHSNSKGGS